MRSNGPADWALVIVGIATAIAAIRTLRAMNGQVAANVKAANASKQSADAADRSLVLLNRPYLDADNWRAVYLRGLHFGDASYISVRFDLSNHSVTPAIIETMSLTQDADGSSSDRVARTTIDPGHTQTFGFDLEITDNASGLMIESPGWLVRFSGEIVFTDIFSKPTRKRVKRFSRIGTFRFVGRDLSEFAADFITPAAVGFASDNYEEERTDEDSQSHEPRS